MSSLLLHRLVVLMTTCLTLLHLALRRFLVGVTLETGRLQLVSVAGSVSFRMDCSYQEYNTMPYFLGKTEIRRMSSGEFFLH